MQTIERPYVSKEQCDKYYVQNYKNFAFIYVEEHDSHGKCGTISIVSNFGIFGHYFDSFDEADFRRFLIDSDFEYMMKKLTNNNLFEFDSEKSIQACKRQVLKERFHNEYSKGIARLKYDELSEIFANNEYEFVDIINNNKHLKFEDIPSYIRKSPCSECVGFWDLIWQPFIEQLKSEI